MYSKKRLFVNHFDQDGVIGYNSGIFKAFPALIFLIINIFHLSPFAVNKMNFNFYFGDEIAS